MAELLQAGCRSCHLTSSIKALKDDSVPDWGQHVAMMGQEHRDVGVGCLALQLRGSIPPVMMTVFLTEDSKLSPCCHAEPGTLVTTPTVWS